MYNTTVALLQDLNTTYQSTYFTTEHNQSESAQEVTTPSELNSSVWITINQSNNSSSLNKTSIPSNIMTMDLNVSVAAYETLYNTSSKQELARNCSLFVYWHNHQSGNISLNKLAFIFLSILGFTAIFVNVAFLVASRFVKNQKDSSLLYIRNIGVANVFLGLFAVGKAFHVTYGLGAKVNFFLSEAFLYTSFLASELVLLFYTLDVYMKIMHPIRYSARLDEGAMIMWFTLLWNISFVFGFSPQMGWSMENCNFPHHFFKYYPYSYLIVLAVQYVTCCSLVLLLDIKIWFGLCKLRKLSTSRENQGIHYQKELRLNVKLIATAGVDLGSLIIGYTPLVVYIFIHRNSKETINSDDQESYLLFFYIGILVKSLWDTVFHGAYTAEIWELVHTMCLARVINRNQQSDEFGVIEQRQEIEVQTIAYNSNRKRSSAKSTSTLTTTVSQDSVSSGQIAMKNPYKGPPKSRDGLLPRGPVKLTQFNMPSTSSQ
ncbi:unnamed protein product [Owenia fusiformis]|uniref:Uncharacterized protein n=1 Tax=Owenia fusiformis TaxID=6347 RepID=A0A8J1XG33_OWEFU|nr:unnamed protein product [Owenia fusiformis]